MTGNDMAKAFERVEFLAYVGLAAISIFIIGGMAGIAWLTWWAVHHVVIK